MLHADYAKIKGIVENAQDKYARSGLITVLKPKSIGGLADGLEYTHLKKKPVQYAPVVEVKVEEDEQK